MQHLSRDSFVAVIMGPSGVGKDTLIAALQTIADPPHIHRNLSWTTRPARPNEPSETSKSVELETFEAADQAGQFLQTQEVYGNWYATTYPTKLPSDTIELFNLLPPSAVKLKEVFPAAKLYLIEPPSIQELYRRLEARGVFDTADLARRQQAAADELAAGQKIADHRIVNETGQQAETAQKLHDLIKADWQAAN